MMDGQQSPTSRRHLSDGYTAIDGWIDIFCATTTTCSGPLE